VSQFSIEPIFRSFHQHDVNYILVGTLGAIAHGARLQTQDADICIATDADNLQRVAAVLVELNAQLIREPARGMAGINTHDWTTLRLNDPTEHHLFETPFGEIDILPVVVGAGGWGSTANYAELSPKSVIITAFGLPIQVAAFDEIMASKLAIRRPQDIAAEAELKRVVALLERGKSPDYSLEQFAHDTPRG
jgi:hypothetical protein